MKQDVSILFFLDRVSSTNKLDCITKSNACKSTVKNVALSLPEAERTKKAALSYELRSEYGPTSKTFSISPNRAQYYFMKK